MRIIIEEVDLSYYQDIILTDEEIERLKEGHILESSTLLNSRRYNVGVRVGEKWRYKPPLHGEYIEEKDEE